jgi:3'-phosphoadenosine 5'-phosphosulfate sulfotransferase (PAPS reductase)/FAD synthetase
MTDDLWPGRAAEARRLGVADPFLIQGPATIAFSGGRTSAFMLYRILQTHGGQLPDDVVVCFANTGKERPETLDFVAECGRRWNVNIIWLEYRDTESGFEIVNHNSASRNGEPFEALIAKRRFLPNGVARFCTVELKIRTQQRYVREVLGWEHWTTVIGFRADEMRRVEKACARDEAGKDRFRTIAPLAPAGIKKADVMAFWRQQPFDLQLKQHEGNCDLCFLKNRAKLREIMSDRPDLAQWWIDQERKAREDFGATTGAGFRPPGRPDYRHLFLTRTKQEELDLEETDALDLCYCGDQ